MGVQNDKQLDKAQLSEDKKMTVYLAGPFFNEKQVATIRKLESFLEAKGYSVYSPSRDGIKLVPNSTKEDRLAVFEDNVTNCHNSDIVVAVIDDRDSGTMVELGMRYSHWRAKKDANESIIKDQSCPRIVTYSDDGWDVNLMILGLTLCHCKGLDELGGYLDYANEVGLDNAQQSESVHKLNFI